MSRLFPVVVSAMLAFCFAGCAASPKSGESKGIAATAARPARINHMVFFKLKNPADADELIADCDATLGQIPGVVSYFAGKPLSTGRGNVDLNFDVGFYTGFATEADYAAYLEHLNHKAAVAKWKPRWEWIRIHDVVDPTP